MKLGVPEAITYAVYIGLALGYFATSWRTILQNRVSMLLVSLFFLATSILIDSVLHSESDLHVLLEDGAKFLGIAGWAAFHIDLALATLLRTFSEEHLKHNPN